MPANGRRRISSWTGRDGGRHHLTWDTYEEGKFTLEEYLTGSVFYKKRPFTRAQFRRFMFAQSKPYPEMIELIARLKARLRAEDRRGQQ